MINYIFIRRTFLTRSSAGFTRNHGKIVAISPISLKPRTYKTGFKIWNPTLNYIKAKQIYIQFYKPVCIGSYKHNLLCYYSCGFHYHNI